MRGSGRDTILTIDLGGRQDRGIVIEGNTDGRRTTLPSDAQLSASLVDVADASGLAPGMVVEFEQDNDAELMYTDPMWIVDWGNGSVGELARVEAVEGNQLRLESGLNSASWCRGTGPPVPAARPLPLRTMRRRRFGVTTLPTSG